MQYHLMHSREGDRDSSNQHPPTSSTTTSESADLDRSTGTTSNIHLKSMLAKQVEDMDNASVSTAGIAPPNCMDANNIFGRRPDGDGYVKGTSPHQTPRSGNGTKKNNLLHSMPHSDEICKTPGKSQDVKRQKMLQTIAGVAGNVLEWYDFAAFGFFSDIIGEVFFPPQEGHAAMIETFTVFGSAFIMRPVGGMFMGYIGDLYGRKYALEISIFLMAFPTFAMGCLPGYDQVGIISTILLILVRLLQGLSVGGQLVSSLVFTVESAPKEQWGLQGSWVMAAANFGTLLGNVVSFALRATLDEEDLYNWGWRIPFLSGVLVSLSGVYLKYYCEEDTVDLHGHGNGANGDAPPNPIKMAFSRDNIRTLISATFVPMIWCGGFYICFVWMATYMDLLIENPVPGAFGVNSLSLLISVCAFFPAAGILSDKYGKRRVMYCGGITLCVISPMMFTIISYGNPYAAFFAQSCLGICLSTWGAPMCAWLVESFPVHVRLTSVAIGYNMAQATIGGASPALATLFVDFFGVISPGFYVSVITLLSLIGLSIAPYNREEAESLNYVEGKGMIDGDRVDGDSTKSNDPMERLVLA